MSPIEIPTVSPMNLWMWAAAAVVVIAVLSVVVMAIKERRGDKRRPGGDMGPFFIPAALAFAVMILALFGATQYRVSSDGIYADVITELEQESGVEILNQDAFGPDELREESNAVPVVFKHEGKVYDGALIIENGTLLLHVANLSEDEREMVVFEG